MSLVDTLEGRNGLALILVESLVNDTPILENDVGTIDVGLEGEGVLHPALVVTVRVVLTSVSTTRLLASSSGGDGLDGALQDVAELKSLNKVTRHSFLLVFL